MTESDDTDILLLIPPNYFATATSQEVKKVQSIINSIHYIPEENRNLKEYTSNVAIGGCDYICDPYFVGRRHTMDSAVSGTNKIMEPTSAIEFLTPSKSIELNNINSRLNALEREKECHFAAASDISTISNGTQICRDERLGMVHSTPKGTTENEHHNKNGEAILTEIDDFLSDRNCDLLQPRNILAMSQQDTSCHAIPVERSQPAQHLPQQINPDVRTTLGTDVNLISLSDIWGKSGQGTAIACADLPRSVYIEEQLRRQHLERTVHLLQTRLLEYQQRLSVAIEVDRAKDSAICSAQSESRSLDAEVRQLRDNVSKLTAANTECNTKIEELQKELAKTISLVKKFQQKSEKLEDELMTTSRKSMECTNLYQQQIAELEVQIHGYKRSEEFATNELNKFRDKLVKGDYLNEKLQTRCDELEKDCATLRHQKEVLQDFQQKQKSRADSLEIQKKSLQAKIVSLTESEMGLMKKIELQQKSLKAHYQQQLENAVEQKMKEFQQQLNKNEDILKSESRERERLIADRAVKQIELINEKNETELNLLQEKHNEEVELYRIQLANASKKIEHLDEQLNAYKKKRAIIAEKLHGVMEDQWQKALEILTSPSSNQMQQINNDTDFESTANTANDLSADNRHYETPKRINTNKARDRTTKIKENNLNNINERQTSPEPMDRLQAYIELLLSKSPSEFDKLDEMLALAAKSKPSTTNSKFDKRLNCPKPPWRA